MYLSDFDYTLPEKLIAQTPLHQRTASRLLCLNKSTGELAHLHFGDFLSLISPKDLVVFNDTKVIPARLYGRKKTGGKIEILIERIVEYNKAKVQLKSNKKIKVGTTIVIEDQVEAQIIGREKNLFEVLFNSDQPLLELLQQIGHLPLPPYVKRSVNQLDLERYQTVFASKEGAIAAPTAGLHFDKEMLEKLKREGIKTTYVTLHVGAGTFKPVTTENILEHDMHSEFVEVSDTTCQLITQTRKENGRVIAIGTTSVRALETASLAGELKPFFGDTKLFIYPGFAFKCVDAMITNFHLPKSTLLMLVSAFGGQKNVFSAYQAAIDQEYRFFSYGDAMFLF